MKRLLLSLFTLTITIFSIAQTVENIRVEPDGENIKIFYRIGGSTDAQVFNVELTCSMDGGSPFEPKSVIGDVGENIRGGRSFYTIVWDVFEDVDEVGEVEFFVKVDLVSDATPPAVQQPQETVRQEPVRQEPEVQEDVDTGTGVPDPFDRRAFIAYNGATLSPYGLSVGTVKNFGLYGSFRFGGNTYVTSSDVWFSAVAGLTKHVFTSNKYRLHGYGGIGTAYASYGQTALYAASTESYFVFDAGIINVIGLLNLTLGLEYLFGDGPDLVFGIGIVF